MHKRCSHTNYTRRKPLVLSFIIAFISLNFALLPSLTNLQLGPLNSVALAAEFRQDANPSIFLPFVSADLSLSIEQSGEGNIEGSALDIYTDGFASLWNDQWAWSITANAAESNTVYSGNHALGLTFTAGWGGYAIVSASPVALTDMDFLQFWIHGGKTGLNNAAVALIDESLNWTPQVPIEAPANQWTQIRIPLTEFGGLSQIKGVVLQERSGAANGQSTFYLDNIQFAGSHSPISPYPAPEPKPTSPPAPTPAPTPPPAPSLPPNPEACRPAMLMGVNLPSLNGGYGADFATVEEWNNYHTYNHDDAKMLFAELAGNGVNSIRWWVFLDGRGAPEFDARGYVTGVDGTLLPSMADALTLAGEYGVTVNFSLWSFEMLARQGVAETTSSGSHGELYKDDAAFESYRQNALIPMANYPTADGYTIATHPYAMFEIINEPEWALNDTDQPPNPEIVDTITTAQLQKFVAKSTGELHRQGATMVGVGQAAIKFIADGSRVKGGWGNLYEDSKLQAYDNDGAQDYYSPHYYDWMNGDGVSWNYNPYAYTKEALGIDKPVIIGEIAANSADRELQLTHDMGYDGAWIWTYDGIDARGSWQNAKPAFQTFAQNHPEAYQGQCD